MNLYFILEGKSEYFIISNWLSFLLPDFQKIDNYSKASENCYYLFDSGGIPHIYKHICNAVKDINAVQETGVSGAYDYLVVMIDSENISPSQRAKIIDDELKKNNTSLNKHCRICIIPQNVCIETWFLGNQKMFSRNSQNPAFLDLVKHYNVMLDDPEQMPNMDPESTLAQFHYKYLQIMLSEKRISYSKGNCREVTKSKYFERLAERFVTTDHIPSFGEFLNLIDEVKK